MMKNFETFSCGRGAVKPLLALVLGLLATTSAFGAGVPVRLSFKFILDGNGNRPATGNLNTDEEITAQVDRGNRIFGQAISELELQNLEVVDVAGIQQWNMMGNSETQRNALRVEAMANTGLYRWRNDAVNIYISASGVSAVADFPPNNNIIVIGQGPFDTTLAHEVGHILNLRHTHEGESDGCTNCNMSCTPGSNDACSDTLADTQCFNRDSLSMNAFGAVYSALNSGQMADVDLTWGNLMSYHDGNNRSRLSPCQLDRLSSQAYDDRNRLLSRIPVYVDAGWDGPPTGSFFWPYRTIQQAVNGGVNGKTIVLEQGTYPHSANPLNPPTKMVTRKGPSRIQEAPPEFSLPTKLEESANRAVRQAVLQAQRSDRQRDTASVIAHLKQAEKSATGRERSALQLELAQRCRDAKLFAEAAVWFQQTAQGADQAELRSHALTRAEGMRKEALREEQQKSPKKSQEQK